SYIQNSTTSSITDVAVPSVGGTSATVTLNRQTSVLLLTSFTAVITGAGGTFGYTTIYKDGSAFKGQGLFDRSNAGMIASPYYVVGSLPAGSHTFDIRWRVDNAGMTLATNGGFLTVLLLGS